MDNAVRRWSAVVLAVLLAFLSHPVVMAANVEMRLKDIGKVVGLTSNQLVGYGVVVGLNGTGDRSSQVRDRSLANMLGYFGLSADGSDVKSKNVASVVVTAKLPPSVREGDLIDVTVSSLFDATSLEGGVLIMTPLKAADGNTYASAQGPVSIGGGNTGLSRGDTRNHPTVGVIPNGAVAYREIPTTFVQQGGYILYSLNSFDFTTASRVAQALNDRFGAGIATAVDGGSVRIDIPQNRADDIVSFISEVENLTVVTDAVAKIVINEKLGVVVMGGNVAVSDVVLTYGNLRVTVASTTNGDGTSNPPTAERIVKVQGATVDDLVRALNAIGTSPRDLIKILETLKASGHLNVDIEVI